MAKAWDSHYEPVQRADQAVHANILEEGAPGGTEGADCGCQFFSTAQPPLSWKDP